MDIAAQMHQEMNKDQSDDGISRFKVQQTVLEGETDDAPFIVEADSRPESIADSCEYQGESTQ